jgi:hypothetical protein
MLLLLGFRARDVHSPLDSSARRSTGKPLSRHLYSLLSFAGQKDIFDIDDKRTQWHAQPLSCPTIAPYVHRHAWIGCNRNVALLFAYGTLTGGQRVADAASLFFIDRFQILSVKFV